jgi:hypothetical protein
VASSIEVQDVPAEQAGSDAYQDEHMGLIFSSGLSFSGFERDKVFLNDGAGRFLDLSTMSGADHPGDGRGQVVADFDDDGDADVFLHNIQRERHALYRNDAAEGRWIKVRVTGTRGARDAAGTVVRCEREDGSVQAQAVALGSGFVSQGAPELIFGLGDAAGAELSVTWPGGRAESFGRVKAGSRVHLVEGRGTPRHLDAMTFTFADPRAPGLLVGPGDAIPELTVLDVDGESRTLELTSDGETLLNLWATTCVGCVGEIPVLQQHHERDGLRVVGLSLDHPKLRAKAGGLLQQRGADYDTWFLDEDAMSALVDPERLTIPTTLRLGPDGTILEVVRGPIEAPGD